MTVPRSFTLVLAGITALVTGTATPAAAATAWRVVPTPNVGTVANTLYGVTATTGPAAWAVGSWYDTSLASPRTLIVRWNGSTWTRVASPNVGPYYNELHGVDATGPTSAFA